MKALHAVGMAVGAGALVAAGTAIGTTLGDEPPVPAPTTPPEPSGAREGATLIEPARERSADRRSTGRTRERRTPFERAMTDFRHAKDMAYSAPYDPWLDGEVQLTAHGERVMHRASTVYDAIFDKAAAGVRPRKGQERYASADRMASQIERAVERGVTAYDGDPAVKRFLRYGPEGWR